MANLESFRPCWTIHLFIHSKLERAIESDFFVYYTFLVIGSVFHNLVIALWANNSYPDLGLKKNVFMALNIGVLLDALIDYQLHQVGLSYNDSRVVPKITNLEL